VCKNNVPEMLQCAPSMVTWRHCRRRSCNSDRYAERQDRSVHFCRVGLQSPCRRASCSSCATTFVRSAGRNTVTGPVLHTAPRRPARRSASTPSRRVSGFSESEVIGVRPRPVKRLPDLPLAHAIDTHPDPRGPKPVTCHELNVSGACAYKISAPDSRTGRRPRARDEAGPPHPRRRHGKRAASLMNASLRAAERGRRRRSTAAATRQSDPRGLPHLPRHLIRESASRARKSIWLALDLAAISSERSTLADPVAERRAIFPLARFTKHRPSGDLPVAPTDGFLRVQPRAWCVSSGWHAAIRVQPRDHPAGDGV
jgi:hypothetical protein